jgi:PAS domain S-box-containing protein
MLMNDKDRAQTDELSFLQGEQLFQTVIANAPILIFALNHAGRFIRFEGKGLEALGLEPGEIIGRSAFEIYRDLPQVVDDLRRALAGETFTSALAIKGSHFEVRYDPVPHYSEPDIAVIGVAVDVTELKHTEAELVKRGEVVEKHNRALVELAKNENLCKGDLTVAFAAITEAAARAMNTQRTSVWFYTDDRTGIRCMDLYEMDAGRHSDGTVLDGARYPSYFQAIRQGNVIAADDAHSDPRTMEFSQSYLTPLGIGAMLDIPIRVAGYTVGVVCHEHIGSARSWTLEEQSFATAVAGFVSTAVEAHERIRAEGFLKVTEQRLRDIVEHSTNLFYMHTADHILTYISPQSRSLLDCEPEEALIEWMNFLTDNPINQRGVKATQQAIDTGVAQPPYELELRGLKGRIVWVEVHEAPIVKDGKTVAIVGALTDITERKRMEEEMLRAQKLESLGILAGGIAHDFNNILTAILGNISLALTGQEPGSPLFRRLKEAETASLRAQHLTQQLLTFSRGGEPIKKTISLERLITDSAGFALRGTNVRFDFHCGEHLWPIEADEGQIGQVINNLVINACQAMPRGGSISINAENTLIGDKDGLPLKAGRYVKVKVKDSGIGIPEEHLGKIFDPYFTTKQKGSGLGLAVTYSVVKNHDGYIDVESKLGAGTTFAVFLPALEKGHVRDESETERHITGQGRILLMDDDEMVRNVAGEMLKQYGYDYALCKDGAEAIELYRKARESGQPFDVLILDLTVPGAMGGRETLRRVLEFDPTAKAIVSSGYSNDPIMAHFEKYGFAEVITKPYKAAELSAVLHKVIAGQRLQDSVPKDF